MENHTNPFNNQSQRRIKRFLWTVESEDNDLTFIKEGITEITAAGDITTTEFRHTRMIGGESVFDASQIVGQCQNPRCQRDLTARTFKHCFYCGTVLCTGCCCWDEVDQRWLCRRCRRSLRWRRFIRALGRVMVRPFRRRV